MPKCPICAKDDVKPRPENPSFPFCTPRCKMIDLGKWLNEEYRIPVEAPAEDDGSASKTEPEPEEPVRH